MFKALFLSLSLVALTSVAAQAAVIISNPWDGTDNDWTKNASGISNAADFDVTGITSTFITGWQNRASTDDGAIGTNLGPNRRSNANPGTMVSTGDLLTSTQFISFTVTNNSSIDYFIDGFSYGIGRNSANNAWLYSTITIGATQTALTADAVASDAAIAADWSNPLVQFGDTTANRWAKPVYDDIGLTLGAGQTAEFRVYMTGENTSMRFHFNDFNVEVTAIPEPSTYAAIFGLVALGGVLLRRCLRG